MRSVFSIVLLVVAAILLYNGMQASESIASTVENAVTGTRSDRSIWLIVGGAVCGVVGLATLTTRGPVRP